MQKIRNLIMIALFFISAILVGAYGMYKGSTFQDIEYPGIISKNNIVDNMVASPYPMQTEITFEFKFDGFKNKYEDLFQTSSLNNGIRMEFADIDASGAWGIVIPTKGEVEGNFKFKNMPTRSVWHSLDIIVQDTNIQVYLDGALAEKIAVQHADIKVDDVAIGTGFSKQRPFNGEIKNFKLRTYKYSSAFNLMIFIVGQLFVVLFLFIVIYWKNMKLNLIWESMKKDKKILWGNIFPSLITLLVIFRSTQRYVLQVEYSHFLYYEYMMFFIVFIYYIWNKLGLKNYAEVMFFTSIIIFLKSFYVHMSYIGAISDLLIMVLLLAALQVGLGILSKHRMVQQAVSMGFSFIGACFAGFLSMGVLYIRYVQKISNTTTLFGEELQAVFQTNFSEAYEFILSVFSWPQRVTIFLVICICFGLLYYAFRNPGHFVHKKLNWCFSGGIIFCAIWLTTIAGFGQSLGGPILQLADGYRNSIKQIQYYQELRKNNGSLQASKSAKGETYVVVIGEAGNKRHYSSYGYFRNTTPWLNSLRQNSNALFLENAYASFVHTVPSLLNDLTSANQYNQEVNFSAPSIIEMAKAAGFKTYWFSNQNHYGLGDNPLTVLAEEADEAYFTPNANMAVDGKLNDLLKEKLVNLNPDENNLIVIHLMGSHAKYKSRLPEGYPTDFAESGVEYLGDKGKDEKFVNDVLNPYDATVKYTDENLENMYDTIAARVPDISAFIYMPDHGEDVYGQKMHNAGDFTFEMARVPFVMMFSDQWKQKYAAEFKQLAQNQDKVFTTDLFFEFLMGVTDIKTNMVDPKMDIGSNQYALNWDNAITLWTDKNLQTQFYNKTNAVKLSDDPEHIKRENIQYLNNLGDQDRFLAIACDSVGEALEALHDGFKGFEINITVQANSIQMGHGPEYVLDMTLDEFLAKMPMGNINKIWLDTKMEDPALIDSAVQQLEELDKKYDLKNRVILESSLVDPKMKIFADRGWQMTFYFLPRLVNIGIECPAALSAIAENKTGKEAVYLPTQEEIQQIDKYSFRLAEVISQQNAKNISFWSESYPFIEKDIRPKLSTDIGYCSFAIPGFPRLSDKNFEGVFETMPSEVLNDFRVHTILIGPESLFSIKN